MSYDAVTSLGVSCEECAPFTDEPQFHNGTLVDLETPGASARGDAHQPDGPVDVPARDTRHDVQQRRHDNQQRRTALLRALPNSRSEPLPGTLAATLAVLGGDHRRADESPHEALDVTRRLRHLGGTASVLEAMAVLSHDTGELARAATTLAEAHALRNRPEPRLRQSCTIN